MSAPAAHAVSPGVRLHLHAFLRRGAALPDARRVILLHHGIGEHGGRYERVAAALLAKSDRVDAVLSYDCRGHGRSAAGKKFCQVNGIDQLADDFGKVLVNHWLKVCHPAAKFILAGHSMGGLVIAAAAADAAHAVNGAAGDRIVGTFLSAPALAVFVPGLANKLLAPFAGPVNRIPGARGIVKANAIPVAQLTRDEEEQKRYSEDELVHSLTSFGLGGDLIHQGSAIAVKMSRPEASNLVLNRLPLLIVYGGAESVVDPAGGPRLLEALKNEESKVVTIPDSRHEIFFDLPESREMFHTELSQFCAKCF